MRAQEWRASVGWLIAAGKAGDILDGKEPCVDFADQDPARTTVRAAVEIDRTPTTGHAATLQGKFLCPIPPSRVRPQTIIPGDRLDRLQHTSVPQRDHVLI